MLTREEILAKDDQKLEEVKVPEWGGSVFVKTMDGPGRVGFEVAIVKRRPKPTETEEKPKHRYVMECMLAFSVCDADKNMMFQPDDIEKLADKNGAALARIFKVAARLNPVFDDDIDEIEKN